MTLTDTPVIRALTVTTDGIGRTHLLQWLQPLPAELAPLIDRLERNAVDYAQQPPFRLEDHLVHGKPVVPAAAHLALIVGMLDDLRGKQTWQLVDVLCEEPLVVDDDHGVVRYQFSRLPEGEAGYSVEVLSDESGRTRRHLRGHAHAAAVSSAIVSRAPAAVPTAAARARATRAAAVCLEHDVGAVEVEIFAVALLVRRRLRGHHLDELERALRTLHVR